MANVFNNFFTKIAPDLANNIKKISRASINDYLTFINKKSMFLSRAKSYICCKRL